VIELGPRLISREDQDVSQAVAGFLKEEGIDVARRQQDSIRASDVFHCHGKRPVAPRRIRSSSPAS
jgi:hypothetical protein